MDPQLSAGLIGLGLLVIASVGAIVKALTDRIVADVAANTQLTAEARDAAEGRLREAIDNLAAERNRVLGLRQLLRERDDRLAFLEARVPGVTPALADYGRRRQDRHTRTEENAALKRLLNGEDPH